MQYAGTRNNSSNHRCARDDDAVRISTASGVVRALKPHADRVRALLTELPAAPGTLETVESCTTSARLCMRVMNESILRRVCVSFSAKDLARRYEAAPVAADARRRRQRLVFRCCLFDSRR